MDDNHFAIDDRLTGNVDCGSAGREPFGPVQPVAGVDVLVTTADVNLDTVVVILDFVQPLVTFRCLKFQRGKMNPGMVGRVSFGTDSTHKKARSTGASSLLTCWQSRTNQGT